MFSAVNAQHDQRIFDGKRAHFPSFDFYSDEPPAHVVKIQRDGKIPKRLFRMQFHLGSRGFAKKGVLTGRMPAPARQFFLWSKFIAKTTPFVQRACRST